jgi:hypothetical protein
LDRPQARLPVEKATRPEVELAAKDASIFFQKLSNSASAQYLKFTTSFASPRLESQPSFLFFPAIMGSVIEPSLLDSLTQKFVSLQTKGGLEHVVSDKLDREALLASLRQLTQALETPSDIVNRVVFFVGAPSQCYLVIAEVST